MPIGRVSGIPTDKPILAHGPVLEIKFSCLIVKGSEIGAPNPLKSPRSM
jgi:hypothetical protein